MIACASSVCVCACGKEACVIEVDVGAGAGGSWSGEDVLEALEDLFLSECLSVVQDLSFGLRDEICCIPHVSK